MEKMKKMKITVRECLELDVFKQCVVVAGEKNLDNIVKTVSVMDATSVNEAVTRNGNEGELVLTTFSGMRKDEALQVGVVRELVKHNVAALVIINAEDDTAHHSYQEVVRTAEELELPLIILLSRRDCDYSQIINDVMEKILYYNHRTEGLINNTITHLLNFDNHGSFYEALREAAINNEFQAVLLSEDLTPLFVVETRHDATIDDAIAKSRKVIANLGTACSLVDVDGIMVYWSAVEVGNEKYYLFIVDNGDNYSTTEITKLAEIIKLSMGMWKYTPQRNAKAEFVKALVRGNRSLAFTLREEVDVKNHNILSVFSAKGLKGLEENKAIKAYEEKGLLRILKTEEEGIIYGVLTRGPKLHVKDDINENAMCIKLYEELKENKDVRIFHVTALDGIEGACDGFRLINETWSVVGTIFPYKRVFTKYELTLVSNCISLQIKDGALKKSYMDLIEYFRKEMDTKTQHLLDTLETFVLDAGMNGGKTAEFMGIHVNTVQYRLKKINDILGAEITGNRVIPGLTMALALQRLESSYK